MRPRTSKHITYLLFPLSFHWFEPIAPLEASVQPKYKVEDEYRRNLSFGDLQQADTRHDAKMASSNEIQWNTIVYILVPLAINTMTQPVGSVLSTTSISATWFRSSSFLCIFDNLVFLLPILQIRIKYKLSWRAPPKSGRED